MMKYISVLLILISLAGCARLKIYHGFELSLPQNGKVKLLEETKPNFFVEWTVETKKLYDFPGYLLEETDRKKKLCLLFSGNYKKEIMGPLVIPLWTREENEVKNIWMYPYLLDKPQKCDRNFHWECISDIAFNKDKGRKAVSNKCTVLEPSLYVKRRGKPELLVPAADYRHLGIPLDIEEKDVWLKLKVPDNWPKNRGYETMFRVILKPAKFYRYSPLASPFDGEVM